VVKEAPPRKTRESVEIEESKVESESESDDGEIIDVAQTIKQKKAEVNQPII
jgi:hypothetical protein